MWSGIDVLLLKQLMEQVNLATTYNLLATREIPIPKIIGALHFITGSDGIPFLQVFTKDN